MADGSMVEGGTDQDPNEPTGGEEDERAKEDADEHPDAKQDDADEEGEDEDEDEGNDEEGRLMEMQTRMQEFDTNKDGRLTLDEFFATVEAMHKDSDQTPEDVERLKDRLLPCRGCIGCSSST
jgi:hypothetical protein